MINFLWEEVMDKYNERGYETRWDYLESLAEEYETDIETVWSLAEVLGESEDFDGLPSSLEDFYL
jgi:hypothetical protein